MANCMLGKVPANIRNLRAKLARTGNSQTDATNTDATAALRIAEGMGLLDSPKTKHVNAKVSPRLFQAAADKVGSTSPAVVVSAALALFVTDDGLGPWLESRWGVLADVDPALLEQIDL